MFERRTSTDSSYLLSVVVLLVVLLGAGIMWPRVIVGTSVERGPAARAGANVQNGAGVATSPTTVSVMGDAMTLIGSVQRVELQPDASVGGASAVIVIAAPSRAQVTRRVIVPAQALISVPYEGYYVAGTPADLVVGQRVTVTAARQTGTGQYRASAVQIAARARRSD